MKSEEFCRILNEIDDDYIIKAHEERKNAKILPIKKVVALVACLVFLAALATAVIAKPEYEIRFEKAEAEEEPGYYVYAELEQFSMKDFSENTKIIGDEIIHQFETYEFYMSSSPDHWHQYYDSYEKAKEFIDFKGFSIPDWEEKEYDANLNAHGDGKGKISVIGIDVFYRNEVLIQIWARALTENYEGGAYQFGYVSKKQYESLCEFENEKGTRFYMINDGEKSIAGNNAVQIYFIKEGVLYFANFAYPDEQTEKAEELINLLIESY
ncbi:MAG: hypothetical protein IJ306_00020 [Oscillospiraceae bacterium]|nr:hypothetical protein [Oscillospiraceae bacterium]